MKISLFIFLPIMDSPEVFAIIVTAMLIILFVILISFFRYRLIHKRHLIAIKRRINHYLVYRINLKLDMVYEFDPKYPGKDRMIPASHYLKRFHPIDAEKIYQWWEHLLKSKLDTPWILTTKAKRSRKQKVGQLIFEVIKVDESKRTIHFHQYGLKYLKPNPKKLVSKSLIISSQQALQIVKKLPTKQGLFISIFMNFPRAGLDEQFKYFYLSQCKEKIVPYLTNQIIMIDTANDILLLVTKSLETHEYMQIAQSMLRVVNQYVELNALESLIKFNMALIEHHHFPNDLRMLIRKSKELNQVMTKRKLGFLTYEKHQPVAETLEKNETVFSDDFYRQYKFSLAYRPLVENSNIHLFAHQVILQPLQPSPLSTLELLQDAPLVLDYSKEFFKRYFYLVQQAMNQSPNKFLVPFSLVMKLTDLAPELKNIQHHDHLIILLDEAEVKELASTDISLKTWADPFRKLGVEFALALDDMTANLDQNLYTFFDYFVIDYRRTINVENSQKTAIQLKLIFQNFQIFQKPFIVIDLLSEASLEYIPLRHVKILGADWISPYLSQPTEPTKKQLTKVANVILKQEQYYGKTN